MTNSQCIEVAEKVWGWNNLPGIKPMNEWSELQRDPEYLKKQVNSWQGFGRTVEAMAYRGYFLLFEPSINKRGNGDRYERMNIEFIKPARAEKEKMNRGIAGFQLADNMVSNVGLFIEYIIKATHLAALETKMENVKTS